MNCPDALAGLGGALDGDALSEAVEQEIADHLEGCESCARSARELSGVHRLLLEQKADALTARRRFARPRPAGPSMWVPAIVAAGFLAAVIALLTSTASDPPPTKIVRPTPEFRKAEVHRVRVEEARREAEDRVDELRKREQDRRKETDDAFAEIVRQRKAEEGRLAKLKVEEEAARQESQKALLVPAPARPMTRVAALRVARVDGKAFLSGRRECREGDDVAGGESIETASRSSVVLAYPDGTRLDVGPDTELRDLKETPAKQFEIRRGSVWADVAKQPQPMRILSPHGEAKVLGTTLRLRVDAGTRLEVEEGKVELRNLAGKRVEVASGQYATGEELIAHPLPSLVFGDTFDGSPANEWPSGWLKHSDGLPRSGFVVQDKVLACPKPPARTTQHAIFPVDVWPSKFTLTYRMKLTGSRTDRAGVEIDDDRQDPSLEYDAVAGVVRVDWPRGKVLKQVPYRIAPGTWTDWSIGVDGRQVRISIDRKPVLDLELADFGRVRGASLVSRGADGAQFDDVKVLRR